jgi:uncharacterized protein YvpB
MNRLQKIIVAGMVALVVVLVVVAVFLFLSAGIGYAQEPLPTRVPSSTPIKPTSTPSPTPFQPEPFTPIPTPTATLTPTITTETPTPEASPTSALPDSAYIEGLYGYPQSFNLSCESRSAADFARHFGVNFSEPDFLYALPISDNPDKGFVGNVNGYHGQIPPNPYGVHARPVAQLLREFGLANARATKGMPLEQLQSEIAAGRPVIIWILQGFRSGESVEYKAQDGDRTIVARWEHTVIVTGYDEDSVRVLDNHLVYDVSYERFLNSWGVMNNMAVFVGEE